MKSRIILCILLSLSICAASAKSGEKGYACKYSCGNYIKIAEENITMLTIEKYDVKGTFSFISNDIVAYIMSREKYWHVIEHNYGPKAKSMGRKFLHPNVDEAKQWVLNNKCKIGRICAPNSDCWGSGSDYCYSDATTDWVNEKSFHYLGMWWTTEWRETCTMDWECKIIQKRLPIHFNSDGNTFIVLDDEKIEIIPGTNDKMIPRKTYIVFIPTVPKEKAMTIHMKCFKHKKDLLCEGANEEMIKFEGGTKCTVLGSNKYCLIEGEFNRIRDFGANLYASVSDLNQVCDAFVVNQERDNYNNFVLSLKIKKIQRILLDVVAALSTSNPQILDIILRGKFFSRHLTNNVYEICSCKEEDTCELREFHSNGVKFCGNKVNSKMIQLFDVNKTIDYIVDDIFKFQGKDAHIIDSIAEEEEKGTEFENYSSGKSFWQGISDSMNPFSWFSSSIGYIALVVAVLAYLKK